MLAFRGIERTTPAFRRELANVAARLKTDPNFLGAVMSRESGFRPEVVNPNGGATGLIQFMPATAKRLGTTTLALRMMSAEEQLPFVEAYYRPFTGRLHSPTDAYMATFLPAFIGKPDDFVLAADLTIAPPFTQPAMSDPLVYTQNAGFDTQHKGFITVGDVGAAVKQATADALTRPLTDDSEPWGWADAFLVVAGAFGAGAIARRIIEARRQS